MKKDEYPVNDTVGVTFHLMGRFEIPLEATPLTAANGDVVGFMLPNGKTYKVQVVMEEASADEEEFNDLGTCELEELGILGFGELDERTLRIGED